MVVAREAAEQRRPNLSTPRPRVAGESARKLQPLAKALLGEQHGDGGWSQLPGMKSDAYATGQALYALRVGAGGERSHSLLSAVAGSFSRLNLKTERGSCIAVHFHFSHNEQRVPAWARLVDFRRRNELGRIGLE